MTTAIYKLLWIKALLQDLGVSHSMPMKLYYDNQFVIHIASSPLFHERTKNIKLDSHFICEHVMTIFLKRTFTLLPNLQIS